MKNQWGRGPSSDDLAQPEDAGLADRLLRKEFARAPVYSAATAGAHIHRELAERRAAPPQAPPRSRSHRAGTLAGLGVVGVVFAVLVVVAPGGSTSKQTPGTIHDVSTHNPLPSSAAPNVFTSTVPSPTLLTNTTTTTTTTTRPAAPPATTLHCILGPIC